jgi:Fe-S cluster biogenesis protein NfuA
VTQSTDAGVQTVLENMETIVASEGGSLEFISFEDAQLVVKYIKGVNEECPECVPDHTMVQMLMESSLTIYAPHVSSVELR